MRVVMAVVLVLAWACGGGGRGDEGAQRQMAVTMKDIAFEPTELEVRAGETVEFVFTNKGQAEHEAVIGDARLQESQEGEADDHAGGHHGSKVPRVVLSPGRTGKLTYTFETAGELFIGCHVPNHWDAGMKVAVTVT